MLFFGPFSEVCAASLFSIKARASPTFADELSIVFITLFMTSRLMNWFIESGRVDSAPPFFDEKGGASYFICNSALPSSDRAAKGEARSS